MSIDRFNEITSCHLFRCADITAYVFINYMHCVSDVILQFWSYDYCRLFVRFTTAMPFSIILKVANCLVINVRRIESEKTVRGFKDRNEWCDSLLGNFTAYYRAAKH
ncbi:hypothetical protein BDC45DRAFT_541823 [Circinella umbellata]|nr:hypothetical protein BDC45DRAFT_541823 [Circinella umbellata]